MSVLRPLACPTCRGEDILYLEQQTSYRRVIGVFDGQVKVEARYDMFDEDHPVDPTFHCQACSHEWAVTENDDLDFVHGDMA